MESSAAASAGIALRKKLFSVDNLHHDLEDVTGNKREVLRLAEIHDFKSCAALGRGYASLFPAIFQTLTHSQYSKMSSRAYNFAERRKFSTRYWSQRMREIMGKHHQSNAA